MNDTRRYAIVSMVIVSIALMLISGCGAACSECAGNAFKVITPGGQSAPAECDEVTKTFCEKGNIKVTSTQAADCSTTVSRDTCPDMCLEGECVSEREVELKAGCDEVETNCVDGIDNDCNDVIDCADSSCLSAGVCMDWDKDGYYVEERPCSAAPAPGSPAIDCAAKGYTDMIPMDCHDGNFDINPGETEVCDESDTDENCNGLANEAVTSWSTTVPVENGMKTRFYFDADEDGFGDPSIYTDTCGSAPTGYVTKGNDCVDDDDSVMPYWSTGKDSLGNERGTLCGLDGEILEVGTCAYDYSGVDNDADGQDDCHDMDAGDCYYCGGNCFRFHLGQAYIDSGKNPGSTDTVANADDTTSDNDAGYVLGPDLKSNGRLQMHFPSGMCDGSVRKYCNQLDPNTVRIHCAGR